MTITMAERLIKELPIAGTGILDAGNLWKQTKMTN